MKGLDTNLLVRIFAGDDAGQAERVTEFLGSQNPSEPGFISSIALCETYWVLRTSYEFTKPQLIDVFVFLLNSKELVLEARSEVAQALERYLNGHAEFSDALIGVIGKSAGCEATYTFDARASRLPEFTLLGRQT